MLLAGITVILALAWCITSLLDRASASFRHMIWTCALAAVLLLAPIRWRLPHRVIAPKISVIATPATQTTVSAAPVPKGSSIDFATILLAGWAFGSVFFLARLPVNAMRMRSVIRDARGVPPILISSRVKGPLVAGVWRTAVLLPAGAETWTVGRRRAVLAHEAAHIRRRDPLILLAAQITTALYWFHPLCWFAAARLRAESERACDDAALRIGLRPSGYAGHLLELACRFDTQFAIPMATTSHLESRVKSILDPEINRSIPPRGAWLAAIALTITVVAPLATLTLRAQQSSAAATINGTVTDPTGAYIPNIQVTAINADTGARETAFSNVLGAYTLNGLQSGYYTIEVQAPGFALFRLENLAVISGAKLEADARLQVGTLAERVTVAAPATPKTQAARTAPAGPVRVGGMVQAARLIQQVNPVYPDDLQAEGIEGTVLLAAIISKQGVPSSLKVLNNGGNDEFANAALAAVQLWRYQPTMLNGEPIEVLTNIQVDFKLSAEAPVIDDRVLKPAGLERRK